MLLPVLLAVIKILTSPVPLDRDPECVHRHLAVGDISVLGPVDPDGVPPCAWEGQRAEAVVLGKGRSRFSNYHPGRWNNVVRAAATLDGVTLKPGEEFRFNEVVGERTSESGFEKAPVFSGGAVTSGVGGGVCQVSSTLYVAALFAGMDIQERHPHRMMVKYVKLGLDAAVDYGRKDLRFRNPFPFPVRIQSRVTDGKRLEIDVRGPMQMGRTTCEVEVIEEEPSSTVVFKLRSIVKDPLEIRGRPRVVVERTVRRYDRWTKKRRLLTTDQHEYRAGAWVIAVTEYPNGQRILRGLSPSAIAGLLAGSKYEIPDGATSDGKPLMERDTPESGTRE